MSRIKYLILLMIPLFAGSILQAQNEACFPPKNENQLVYDISDLLSSDEESQLEQSLQEFSKSTSNQIVIVVVDDICGMDKAQYAIELGEAWGVGQAEQDNGVVILVKPTGAEGERLVFIAIGRGLEGIIPDATADIIVRHELIPNFKQGAYYTGLANASQVIMELARQEYSFESYGNKQKKAPIFGALIVFLIIIFVIIVFAFRAKRYANLNDLSFWTAFWLLSNSGRSHGGTWGNFHGGSGGFGGGGGGGFGGFGGGSFGGGGAGGSW